MKAELDTGYMTASVVLGTVAHLWLHYSEPLTALQGVGYTLGIPGSAALLINMTQNSGSVARVGAIEGGDLHDYLPVHPPWIDSSLPAFSCTSTLSRSWSKDFQGDKISWNKGVIRWSSTPGLKTTA